MITGKKKHMRKKEKRIKRSYPILKYDLYIITSFLFFISLNKNP